jgi:hypothetical protein
VQLDAGLEVGLRLALPIEAHGAGRHALDGAVLAVEHLGRGEARIDLGALRLGLLAQPFDDVAHADDEVAVVAHLRRRRQGEGTRLGQEEEAVGGDRHVQGRIFVLPVRDQLRQRARLEDRAREGVRAKGRALLEHADADLAIMLHRQLPQADRRREPGRAGAHDHHVELHALPFHGPSARRSDGRLARRKRPRAS